MRYPVEIVIGGVAILGEYSVDDDQIVTVWAPNGKTRPNPQGNSPALDVARRLLYQCYANFANPTITGDPQ